MGTHSSVKACISVYFTQCQDATVSLGWINQKKKYTFIMAVTKNWHDVLIY